MQAGSGGWGERVGWDLAAGCPRGGGGERPDWSVYIFFWGGLSRRETSRETSRERIGLISVDAGGRRRRLARCVHRKRTGRGARAARGGVVAVTRGLVAPRPRARGEDGVVAAVSLSKGQVASKHAGSRRQMLGQGSGKRQAAGRPTRST